MARPALVIGLGGTGQWVLTYIKKELLAYTNGHLPKEVKLLVFDTARPLEEKKRKPGDEEPIVVEGVRMEPGEFHHLGGNIEALVREIVNQGKHEHLSSWLQAKTYLTRLSPGQYDLEEGAGQMRPFGRMAVFKDLEASPEASRLFGSIRDAIEEIRAEVKSNRQLEISIVGSLSGGTGAGMCVDIAHLARTVAETSIGDNFVIRGFFVLPGAFKRTFSGGNDGPMKARAFAALREISRFLTVFGDRKYPMVYNPNPAFRNLSKPVEKRLFDLCYVIDANRERNPLDNVSAKFGVFPSIADAILAFLDEKSGQNHTEHVKNIMKDLTRGDDIAYFSSLGTYSFNLPMHDIVEEHACELSLDYLTKIAKPEFDDQGHPIRLATMENLEKENKTGGEAAEEFMNDPGSVELRGPLLLKEINQIVDQGGNRSQPIVQQFSGRAYVDLLPLLEPDDTGEETRNLRDDVRNIMLANKLSATVKPSRELKRKPALDNERVEKEVEAFKTKFLGRNVDGRSSGGKYRESLDLFKEFQVKRFRDCLTMRCEEFLNGITQDDYQKAKSGKLGFTSDFIKALVNRLDRFVSFMHDVREARQKEGRLNAKREELQSARKQMFEDKDKAGWLNKAGYTSQELYLAISEELMELEKDELLLQYVEGIAKAFLDHCIKARESIESWEKALALGSSKEESLYSRLRRVREEVRARRDHTKNFGAVRREETDEDFETNLYRRYAEEQLKTMFKLSHWQMSQEEGTFTFSIGDEPFLCEKRRPNDRPAEMNSRLLMNTSRSAFVKLPESASIASRLMNIDGGELAETLYQNGSPMIRWKSRPPFAKAANFLTVHYTKLDNAQPYFNEVLKILGGYTGASGDMAQLVDSEGANKCSLVYTMDVVNLDSLTVYDSLYADYVGYPDDKRLLHNFPAEVNTVHYEQRLDRLDKPYRMFNPRITFLLEHRDWVRQFLRCLVYGLVAKQASNVGHPYYALALPKLDYEGKSYRDTAVELSLHAESKPDFMQAMDTFVFKRKDIRENKEVPIPQPHLVGALIEAEKAIGDATDNIRKLEGFMDSELQPALVDIDGRMHEDLSDLFRLILLDEIDRLTNIS